MTSLFSEAQAQNMIPVPDKRFSGHSMKLLDAQLTPEKLDDRFADNALVMELKAFVVGFQWAQVEPSKGVFDYSFFDDMLARAAAVSAIRGDTFYVNFLFHWREFKGVSEGVSSILPPDLQGSEGAYVHPGPEPENYALLNHDRKTYAWAYDKSNDAEEPYGYNLALWNEELQARIKILLDNLGARYDKHPNFGRIGTSESAFGTPAIHANDLPSLLPGYSEDAQIAGQVQFARAMRSAFHHTLVSVGLNFPVDKISSPVWQSELIKGRFAISTPNSNEHKQIVKTDPPGILTMFTGFEGVHHLICGLQNDDYNSTEHEFFPVDDPSYEYMFNRCVALGANEIEWLYVSRIWTGVDNPQGSLKTFLQTHPAIINGGSAGGLNVTKPAALYPGLQDKLVFNKAVLKASLTHSLILEKGDGYFAATRPSEKRIFDNEGKLITVPAGAAAFGGARVVENRLSKSKDLTDASWNVFGLTSPDDITIQETGINNQHVIFQNFSITPKELSVSITVEAKSNGTDYLLVRTNASTTNSNAASIMANVSTGVIHGAATAYGLFSDVSGDITASDNGYYIITLNFKADTANNRLKLEMSNDGSRNSKGESVAYLGDTSNQILIRQTQLEFTGGQADTTDSEYVSNGVLPPPYHGLNADGIQAFNTHKNGSKIPARDLKGAQLDKDATNDCLWSRDLTNGVWIPTNVTPLKDQTGIDNIASSASSLELTSTSGTIIQSLTLAKNSRTFSLSLKRVTGNPTIEITRDNGGVWTDVTAQVLESGFTRVKYKSSVLNPQIGIRMTGVSGDKITVDYCQDQLGEATGPIYTEGTAESIGADSIACTYALNDTEGAIAIEVHNDNWAGVSGYVGSATKGLLITNGAIQMSDGIKTIDAPSGTLSGSVPMAIQWGNGKMRVGVNGNLSAEFEYLGSMSESTVEIKLNGSVKNWHVWDTAIRNQEFLAATKGVD